MKASDWSWRNRFLASPFILAILLLNTAWASSGRSIEELESYAEQAARQWNVPGLAFAVVKDDQVVLSRGYGVREVDTGHPVNPATRFAIGSTTKAMTAAAMGLLIDEGRARWDDPVIDHLPTFRLADPYLTREVTLRDLLTHRAGLGNADFLWYGQQNSSEEIVRRLRFVPTAYSLRSGFIYQNIMYAAAGQVISTLSGLTWGNFIESRLLRPLGMNQTVTSLAELEGQPDVASPHDRVNGTIEVIENASVDSVAAAGSIWSSVEDMTKWMRFLLREGTTLEGRMLLKAETVGELFRPQAIVDSNSFYPTARLTKPRWTTYGLGWFQADYQGRAVDFHTGSIDGMVAIVGLIRDENLGVCVLGNLDHAEVRHALMYRTFDHFGPGPLSDWSSRLAELYAGLRKEAEEERRKVEESRVPDTSPSLALPAYAATYSDRLYGEVLVNQQENGLWLWHGPGLQGPLEHWHHDTFRVSWQAKWRGSALVRFVLDASGAPTTLAIGGRVFRRQREYPDR